MGCIVSSERSSSSSDVPCRVTTPPPPYEEKSSYVTEEPRSMLGVARRDALYKWWSIPATRLEMMLVEAGYDKASKDQAMKFFHSYFDSRIRSGLGDNFHLTWKSLMTDDFSPIEFSWKWDEQPKVNYSVEVVGSKAGSEKDQYNRLATLSVIEQMKRHEPQMDWSLFESLLPALQAQQGVDTRDGHHSDPSSLFLSVETSNGRSVVKNFMIPPDSTRQSGLDFFDSSVPELRAAGLTATLYKRFMKLLQPDCGNPDLTCLAMAVDNVEPAKCGVKYFVRTPDTSFDNIRRILLMNDLQPRWTDEMFSEFQSLWQFVLGLPEGFSHDKQLPVVEHETAGITFDFDIQAGEEIPTPTVYIPVRHYAKSDLAVLNGLEHFFEHYHKGSSKREVMAKFKSMLNKMAEHRSISDGRGIQTYIACTPSSDGLAVTSYLSPELYKSGSFILASTMKESMMLC